MVASHQWVCEASAAELADALETNSTTSVEIVTALVERIDEIDGAATAVALRSVIAVADSALDDARRADDERRAGRARGPLHGVPILVKDNIEARGLPGTAGSTSLIGRHVERDAPLVARLREAGLIVAGATNLSEWANFRSPLSTSGWSGVGGLCVNPFRLDRSAGGSSSGAGASLAARLTPLAVGTETNGSITCPASLNGVVGLKPAVGTVSAVGVAPIASSQDSPGPMARTVMDVAALFEVLSGRGGASTRAARGLDGARVAGANNLTTGHPATDALFASVVSTLRAAGVVTRGVDVAEPDAGVFADEVTVLLCEMADDLNAFLLRRGGDGPSSVAELIEFNRRHSDVELVHFGQEYLERALATGGRADPAYAGARSRNLTWARERCLEPALAGVDCYVAASYGPAWKNDLVLGGSGSAHWSQVAQAPSVAGWPIATVPMGAVDGLPVGLSIVGRPGAEEMMLGVAREIERVLDLRSGDRLVPRFEPCARG